MTVPFYGLEFDRFIHLDADPQPLLDELATCFEGSRPIPTDLAYWFWHVWNDNRVSVAPLPPTNENLARQDLALKQFDEYVAAGLTVSAAENKTIRTLKLDVGRSTLKAWRTNRAKLERQIEEERNQYHAKKFEKEMLKSKTQAIFNFNALASQGVSREKALDIVMNQPLQTVRPSMETFEGWLDTESAYAKKSST